MSASNKATTITAPLSPAQAAAAAATDLPAVKKRTVKKRSAKERSAAKSTRAANNAPAANQGPLSPSQIARRKANMRRTKTGHELDPTIYLDFVRKVASRMARNLPSHVSLDDLIGAGILGLIDAMERYDPEKSDRFETFAEFRVKGAILDELRRYDLMARNARLTSKRLARMAQELTAIFGRPPTESEIARALDLGIQEYRNLVNRVGNVRVLSLDDLTGANDTANDRSSELSAPGIAPDEASSMRELQQHLEQAISGLPARQQKILDMYYRREMTLKQIGIEVGVTESRVCQIMGEATKKLRGMLRQETRHG